MGAHRVRQGALIMKTTRTRLAWLAASLAVAPLAGAALPAPYVTVGAGLKQFRFDWDYIPRSNYFELWFKANDGAAWIKYGETPAWRPRINISVSAHFLNWQQARYRVRVCNPSGCTDSNEVGVAALMPDTVGKFTAGDLAASGEAVGWSVALSADAKTLVSGSPGNGAGAAFVWKKSGDRWLRDAVLRPDLIQATAGYDLAVATSGDGNLVALGTRSEDRPGVDPENEGDTGAVRLYRRGTSGWNLEQILTIPNAAYGEAYGRRVQLDDAGNTLAVWRAHGGKPGINAMGNIDIYTHGTAGWTRVTTLQIDTDLADCAGMGLSGDGRTLVRACVHSYPPPALGYVEVFRAPSWAREAKLDSPMASGHETRAVAIARDGNSFAVRHIDGFAGHSQVEVFRFAGAWQSDGILDHGAWSPDQDFPARTESNFGEVSSMSADGRFLAVGDWGDTAQGYGVLYPPISGNGPRAGAVYVFERKSSGWKLRHFIRPNVNSGQTFGWVVSFGDNGKSLAVGAREGVVSLY
jgi:hypothetical protein